MVNEASSWTGPMGRMDIRLPVPIRRSVSVITPEKDIKARTFVPSGDVGTKNADPD